MSDLIQRHIHEAQADLAAKEEAAVKDVLRMTFGYSVGVEVRQPRWMPWWLYRRLMRTIVVKETPLTVTPDPIPDFLERTRATLQEAVDEAGVQADITVMSATTWDGKPFVGDPKDQP